MPRMLPENRSGCSHRWSPPSIDRKLGEGPGELLLVAGDEVFLSAGLEQAELGRRDAHGEVVGVGGIALVVAEAQLGSARAVFRGHAARCQERVAAVRAQLILDRARPERKLAALRVV